MATITIKNIPDDLYEKLKTAAEANRRSINSEVITYIEQMVYRRQRTPVEVLAQADQLREMTAHYKITDEELEDAINEGRL